VDDEGWVSFVPKHLVIRESMTGGIACMHSKLSITWQQGNGCIDAENAAVRTHILQTGWSQCLSRQSGDGKSGALSVIESQFSSPRCSLRFEKRRQSLHAAVRLANSVWNYTACLWSENICVITWSIVWHLQLNCCSGFAMRRGKPPCLLPKAGFHSRGKYNFKCHNRSLSDNLTTRLFSLLLSLK
jgi:hypothetical protein